MAKSFADYTEQDYCREYGLLERDNKFIDQLQALVSVVKITEMQNMTIGYAVIFIQFDERRVQLKHYPIDALEEASKYYSEVEKSINDATSAVVLVSVSDMNELKEAYIPVTSSTPANSSRPSRTSTPPVRRRGMCRK